MGTLSTTLWRPSRRDIISWIVVAVGLIGSVSLAGHLTDEAREREPLALDRLARAQTTWLHGAGRVGLRSLGVLSSVGSGVLLLAILAAAVAVLVVRGRRVDAAFVVVAVEAAHLAGRLAKAAIHRPRPANPLSGWFIPLPVVALLVGCVLAAVVVSSRTRRPVVAAGFVALLAGLLVLDGLVNRAVPLTKGQDAFPSGHATGSMALGAAVVLVVAAGFPLRRTVPVAALAAVYVIGVGTSRVLLGYHQVTDVLAGWSLSIAVVLTLWSVLAAGRAVIAWRRAATTSPVLPTA